MVTKKYSYSSLQKQVKISKTARGNSGDLAVDKWPSLRYLADMNDPVFTIAVPQILSHILPWTPLVIVLVGGWICSRKLEKVAKLCFDKDGTDLLEPEEPQNPQNPEQTVSETEMSWQSLIDELDNLSSGNRLTNQSVKYQVVLSTADEISRKLNWLGIGPHPRDIIPLSPDELHEILEHFQELERRKTIEATIGRYVKTDLSEQILSDSCIEATREPSSGLEQGGPEKTDRIQHNDSQEQSGISIVAYPIEKLNNTETWKTGYNGEVKIKEMSSGHLINTCNYLERTGHRSCPTRHVMVDELKFRGTTNWETHCECGGKLFYYLFPNDHCATAICKKCDPEVYEDWQQCRMNEDEPMKTKGRGKQKSCTGPDMSTAAV